MEALMAFIQNYGSIIMIMNSFIIILLLLLLVLNYRAVEKLKDKYKKVLKGSNGKNIEGILEDHLERVETVHQELQGMEGKLAILENRLSFSLQRVGFIRYSAFNDTGSDLSYSIALLDEHNDGFVITGIHGRVETMSYAKPIKDGKSTYALSIEEQQAIDRAKETILNHVTMKGTRNS